MRPVLTDDSPSSPLRDVARYCLTSLGTLLLTLTLTGCGTPDVLAPPRQTRLEEPVVTVPFTRRGLTPTVEVYLGEAGPFRFLVDTGAGPTLISPGCARAAGVELHRESGTSGGLTGTRMREITIARLPALRLGGVEFLGVPVVVEDLSSFGLDGILGYRTFADVLLTIDGPREAIRLEHGVLPSPQEDSRTVTLGESDNPSPRVWGEIGETRALFLIDTGFDGHLFLAQTLPEDHGFTFELDPTVKVEIRSRFSTDEAKIGHLRDPVRVGPVELNDVPTILGRGGPVILGAGFLEGRALTFDQENERVRFEESGVAP